MSGHHPLNPPGIGLPAARPLRHGGYPARMPPSARPVDVATISILQERIIRESAPVNEQLQRALNSRVLIEQAKGAIAYTSRLNMDEAFQRLRSYARSNSKSLQETAARVIDGTLRL
jgi:ANTAR domain